MVVGEGQVGVAATGIAATDIRGVAIVFEPLARPNMKVLSILIPVYNEERYLAAVVKKVVDQPLPAGLSRRNYHGE